jgi:GntR family transcriptional repressor for pyruvate dehydrogenase complex
MPNEMQDSSIGSPLYTPIKSSRLYEQIVEQIERSIRKGKLKPGEQLPPERELAQRLGVSRTAVREAIQVLREKRLVDIYSGRGTFITNPAARKAKQSLDLKIRISREEGLMHLAELRQILEPEIAALAASRMDEQLLSTMREAVAVMDISLHDPQAYVEADLDFHLAMAEAAGNPLVLSLLDSIVGILREQRTQIFNVDGGPARGQYHHKRILQAMERKDADAARDAMHAHQQQVREDSSAAARNAGRKTTP